MVEDQIAQALSFPEKLMYSPLPLPSLLTFNALIHRNQRFVRPLLHYHCSGLAAAIDRACHPDNDSGWALATSGTAGNAGITYVNPVVLTGDTEVNRCILQCAPQLKVLFGNLLL